MTTTLPALPRFAVLATVSVLAAACANASPPDGSSPERAAEAPSPNEALPEGHPPTTTAAASQMTKPGGVQVGTVLETLDGGGYTYARLHVGEREMWVAGPTARLEVGQQVRIADAVSMGSFASPSLERTFDELFFVGGFQSRSAPPDAAEGEALEVVVGGGYTYVRARVGDDQVWLAGPLTEIPEGSVVLWRGGTEMGEFYSASLDRTFDNIVFVGRFWVEVR